jgi:hypothetical protein
VHAGEALWNLHVLIVYLKGRASKDPGLQAVLEHWGSQSCVTLSDFLKVPLPQPEQSVAILAALEALRASYPAPSRSPEARPPAARSPGGSAPAVAMALDHCSYILAHIEDLPDEAFEFASSVEEKARSMQESITQRQSVSPKMLSALENMHHGVDKWLNQE